jgi:hypothetical protein
MKPSAIRIERMLEKIEATLPSRPSVRIEWEIVHPSFIISADGRVRWPETIEGEDTDKDTDKDTDASETLRTGLDQAGSTPELDGKGGPHRNHEPIDLPPPDPGCLARSKPWRDVHQRPARDQRRPTWKKWEGER